MRPFKVYNDTQHGWIAVKRILLKNLGIFNKITPFSYQRGQTVYLEEDLDAATFIKAYEVQFGKKPEFEYHNSNYSSPIRRYDHFRAEEE